MKAVRWDALLASYESYRFFKSDIDYICIYVNDKIAYITRPRTVLLFDKTVR